MTNFANVLVTGASSGLGKHCCEFFQGTAFSRQTSFADIVKQAANRPFRAIIHTAFNTKSDINNQQLYTYLNDTILLTKKMLEIPHEKFIFISSIDVYPKDGQPHQEDEEINVKDVQDIYGIAKLLSESIVQNETKDYLILRPSALLGRYARPSSVIKILTQDNATLTLAGNSSFNYVRHDDLSHFIQKAMMGNLTGVYNLAAASNIELIDVSRHFNRSAIFGDYVYKTGTVKNEKAAAILGNLNNTSLENIRLFLRELELGQ